MSEWAWVWTAFIIYWVVVFIWIKGTDPLSSAFWHWLWLAIKIPLMICTGFIIFALFCRED
jgi:hypothetical protein